MGEHTIGSLNDTVGKLKPEDPGGSTVSEQEIFSNKICLYVPAGSTP